MPLINERLDPHISRDHAQPSVDGRQIASLSPEWKSLLQCKFVNWLFIIEGISRLYITGDTKDYKNIWNKNSDSGTREPSYREEAWSHFWDSSQLFYEFIQGLAYFLISEVIHNLSISELVIIGWYRCVSFDCRERVTFLGVRQKNVFELNPKSWVRFRKVGRIEETDWPIHFKVKINYGENHRWSKLELSFHCPCPVPLYLLWGGGGGCSIALSCLTLCDPMDCNMAGFPVLHHLPEFA